MPVSVRKATVADIDKITRLNREIQNIHVELEPSIFRDSIEESDFADFWKDVFKDGTNVVLVAEMGSRICGYTWIQAQNRPRTVFNHARRRIYLHHVGVDPALHRRGIGSRLLREVEYLAIDSGVDKVILDCWATNEPAQMFFRKSGFGPLNVVLSKALPAHTSGDGCAPSEIEA